MTSMSQQVDIWSKAYDIIDVYTVGDSAKHFWNIKTKTGIHLFKETVLDRLRLQAATQAY